MRFIAPILLYLFFSFEVSDLIKNLDESKSPDSYNIPVELIKLIPYNMSVVLTDIFNESFKTGILPDLLKLAHVTPIHKAILDWQSQTTGQYLSYPSYVKFLNKLCIKECMTS